METIHPETKTGVAESPRDVKRREISALHLELARRKAIKRHYVNELDNVERPGRPTVVEEAAEVRQDVMQFLIKRIAGVEAKIAETIQQLADLGEV